MRDEDHYPEHFEVQASKSGKFAVSLMFTAFQEDSESDAPRLHRVHFDLEELESLICKLELAYLQSGRDGKDRCTECGATCVQVSANPSPNRG